MPKFLLGKKHPKAEGKRRSLKLRTRLFLTYVTMFAIVMAVLVGVLTVSLEKLLTNQLGQARLAVLEQIGERTTGINNTATTIVNLYGVNPVLRGTLSNALTPEAEATVQKELAQIKRDYDTAFGEVGVSYEVVVIGANGFNYASADSGAYDFEGLQKQLWYRNLLSDTTGGVMFVSSYKNVFAGVQNQYVFGTARKMYTEAGAYAGMILINIDEGHLEGLTGNPGPEDNIYIVDNKGKVVSHREKAMLGLGFIDIARFEELYGKNNFNIVHKLGEKYLLTSYYDEQTGWLTISEVPTRVIFGDLYKAYQLIGIACIVGALAMLVYAVWSASRIARPLHKLSQSMDAVSRGDLDERTDIQGYYEVESLQHSFNTMTREIQRLMDEIRERENKKRKAELDFLRAQINPHFLYNTLFSIQCLVETGKTEKAVYMMEAFINLLRKTLAPDTDLVTLREELDITQGYMELQKFRYGEKIGFEIECDESTLECMVPSLLLQPLVENAIFHGLEPKGDEGTIVVQSYIKGRLLYIEVSDDGVGAAESRMSSAIAGRKSQPYSGKDGLGLSNVQSRIRHNFGEEYGLEVNSTIGIGTTIRVVLPVIEESQYKGEVSIDENIDS